MTVKNDGNFGSESNHRCLAKGELATNSWKSIKADSEQIKVKNWLVSTGRLHISFILRNQSSSPTNQCTVFHSERFRELDTYC